MKRLDQHIWKLEEQLAAAPALPPAYRQSLKDAIKHLKKADFALNAAEMILAGGQKTHWNCLPLIALRPCPPAAMLHTEECLRA